MFEHGNFQLAVCLGNARRGAECAYGFGRIAPLPHAAEGRHTRIRPAFHLALVHQLFQIALGHYRALYVQAREFYLPGSGNEAAVGLYPIVQGAVVFEFQRADGMGYALERVFQRVREVVHGIDAPLIARAVVRGAQYAVDDGVAHVDIGRSHIYLGAEHLFAVGVSALLHLGKQAQIFFHAPVSPRAIGSGRSERSARGSYLLRRIVAHIGKPLFDQLHRAVVHTVEVVGSVKFRVPLKAQPFDVLFYRVDVLDVLFARIGIVVAQIAPAAVLCRNAEVYTYRLCVPYMQIAVGFGRKAGYHLFHLARSKLFFHNVFNKVA